MANVKAVIALLCKHINLSLNINAKPEHFRLAKFDKTDERSVHHMWDILHQIITRLNRRKTNHFSSDDNNIVNSVKQHFALLNYENIEFYCLPSDMSLGSRELLLALAWLIATENILEKLLVEKLRKSLLNQEFYDENMSKHHHPEITQSERTGPLDHQLNFILWAAGKIGNNIRAIEEADAKRVHLTTQVHQGSLATCGLPHASVSEARLAQQPHLLDEYLSHIEPNAQLVEAHKQWRLKASLFWDWMESVLDEKNKCQAAPKINIGQKNSLAQFVDYLRCQLNTSMSMTERNISSMQREESNGAARLILTSEKQIKLKEWSDEAEKQVSSLQSECSVKAADTKGELLSILEQINGVELIMDKVSGLEN